MWARELGAKNGLVIPNQAAEHYYLITDTIDGLDPNAPVFEDPASYGYYREEGGGMMVGLFEPQAAPWKVEGIPRDFSFGTIPPDWDRMGPFLEKAMARVPVTLEVGVRTFFCGPESFTPDLAPAVGEAPGIRNYFVAAGMNSVGILSAGGLGRVLAHWITTGRPDVDVTGFNVDRFRPWQADDAYRAARTTEILGTVYAAHTPGKQLRTARNTLLSPVHDRLVEQGGYLREVSGWEGADWFAGPGATPTAEPTWGRAPWFEQWEAEHRAVREGVGLMDMSFMAKFRVQGADAGDVLDQVSAGAVNEKAETITYTQWLDEDGRIEGDLTVTKLGEDDFFVVASDTAHGHSLAWLARHAADADCTVTDVTADYGQLNVQGPRSREVLAELTDADLSTEVFRFRTARWLELAGVRGAVRADHLPRRAGLRALRPGGRHACACTTRCRPPGRRTGCGRSGSRRWPRCGWRRPTATSATTSTTPTARSRPGSASRSRSTSRAASSVATRCWPASPPTPRRAGWASGSCRSGCSDPEPLLYHAEVLHRDGEAVGYVRAASYGWTLGGAVGLAMVSGGGEPVTPDWLEGRHLGGRHRRRPVPGRGVAAPDVRPDLGPDQDLNRLRDPAPAQHARHHRDQAGHAHQQQGQPRSQGVGQQRCRERPDHRAGHHHRVGQAEDAGAVLVGHSELDGLGDRALDQHRHRTGQSEDRQRRRR